MRTEGQMLRPLDTVFLFTTDIRCRQRERETLVS